MAFNDNPVVDENSNKSAESVLKVKSIFTQRNGFIPRGEDPDFGVDLDVELIENNEATSQKFPIQIKSSTNPKVIELNEQKFITLEFKTSRLGYLCRRPPTYGIIVMYDDSSKIIYFDYVDNILKRIKETRTDDWESQEQINIHIPLNVLDDDTARLLHARMLARHKNHELLLISQGENYGIPSYSSPQLDQIDFNDSKQVIKFLENYGAFMYNEQEFIHIEALLSKLSRTDIQRSDDLIFLAAITYSQLGDVIEADYYIDRFYRRKNPPIEAEIELIEFSKIKVKFLKGDTDHEKFLTTLDKLKSTSKSPLNIINLEINSTYIKLLGSIEEENSDIDIEKTIDNLFDKIENAPLDQKDKNFLTMLQSQNLNVYACKAYTTEGNKLRIQADLRANPNNTLKRLGKLTAMVQKSIEYVANIYNYGKANNNILLQAYSLHHVARFFLNYQYALMMLSIGKELKENESLRVDFNNKINIALSSFDLCVSQNMHDEAHRALGCAYELKMIYMVQYEKELGARTFYEIETVLIEIERLTGIPSFKSMVKESYEGLKTTLETKTGAFIKDKTQEELEQIAMIILKAYELPIERLPNVIHEAKVLQVFDQNCTNKNIEILQDRRHLDSKETAYAEPPKFILRSKISGMETKPSHDIEVLLNEFSTIIHNT